MEGRRIKRDYEIKKRAIVVSMIIFCTFAPNYKNEHLGSTGFDSKWHEIVSIPSCEMNAR